ncbi:MAG: hypothetical protein HYZ75_05690 [Elusimicrobia bacterium]|nr:hypothetical protein [Elusimicrobiota bacterium]
MKYYAYLDKRLNGPLEAETLTALPDFSRLTLVQTEDRYEAEQDRWTEAGDVPLLALLLETRERRARTEANRRQVAANEANRRAALEAAAKDLSKIEARLASVETALTRLIGRVTLAAGGAAVLAVLGLCWSFMGRAEPTASVAAPPVPGPSRVSVAEIPAAVPVPAADVAARPAAPPRRAVPARPAAPDPDESEAVALVRRSLIPEPDPVPCPRSYDEAVLGEGGPARTPRELVDCWAWRRFSAAAEGLSASRRWSKRKAVKTLSADMEKLGGFEGSFPWHGAAKRLAPGVYEVEVGRSDRLTRVGELRLRYRADLRAGTVNAGLALDAPRRVR